MNTDALVKNKTAVLGIVILLLAFFLYSIVFSPDTAPANEPVVTDQNLVETANELSGITFKQELFSTPAYKALVDFSAPLPTEQPGRRNPFEALGRE